MEPGSGTGIFSRLLLAPATPEYPSFNLKTLVSVEPSSGMRGAWERGLAKVPQDALEGGVDARTVDGGFDDLTKTGLDKGLADAVIIAQAWHWCPDHEKALTEIASALKPGAPLVLIWNLESNEDAWNHKLREYYQAYDLGTPQYYRGLWRAMFDSKAYKELFQPAEEKQFSWTIGMTEDQVVDRLFSKSYLTEAHLNGDKRVQFEKDVRKIISDGPHEWIDEKVSYSARGRVVVLTAVSQNGIFKYKYNTDVVVIRKAE